MVPVGRRISFPGDSIDHYLMSTDRNGCSDKDGYYIERTALINELLTLCSNPEKRCTRLLKAPPASGKTALVQAVLRRWFDTHARNTVLLIEGVMHEGDGSLVHAVSDAIARMAV